MIGKIDLTEQEEELYREWAPQTECHHHADWLRVAAAQRDLFQSLAQREGIPQIRKNWFVNPELFIGGHKKSRKDRFIQNGCKASEIPSHPHFKKYLYYFINGAELPNELKQKFQSRINDSHPISSGDLLDLTPFLRSLCREYKLSSRASEEFFKLALDVGLPISVCKAFRNVVQNIK